MKKTEKQKNSLSSTNWHAKDLDFALKETNSSIVGLTTAEVQKRLAMYGENSLPQKKSKSVFLIFLQEILNPIVLILVFAMVFSFVVGEILDAFVILAIVMIDAVIGTVQSKKAERIASSLSNMIKVKSKVLRDENKTEVESKNLVPGDIVFLESGDKICADLRIISCNNLSVDESLLTGESLAVVKNTNVVPEKCSLADRTNMLFSGSSVVTGRATAVVVETGVHTQIGHIATNLNKVKDEKSPLTIRIGKFSKQISIAIVLVAVVIFLIMLMQGNPFKEIFLIVIALAVSAMPEGLPLAVTMALTIASNRMGKNNVVVKNLNAVESLGSCTVIATDKTGTLTLNEQTAKIVMLPNGEEFSISGSGYNDEGQLECDDKQKITDITQIAQMGVLNNEAVFEKVDSGFNYFGDSIDIAFKVLGKKLNVNTNDFQIVSTIPYESENKYSAVFFKQGNKTFCTVKGSVERILEFSNSIKLDGQTSNLNAKDIIDKNELLAKRGYRVIAVALGEISSKQNYDENDLKNLTLLGLVGFIDPVRNESKTAVADCISAGIKVVMITGDHPATAFSIANDTKIASDYSQVATGAEVEKMFELGEIEFDKFVKQKTVFSRVTPTDKLHIVDSLKRQGEFVAVTGDGVNDSPAIKSAHIGIAMGSGTDVAKETADMIILDDNFNSIVKGVKEGRNAYANIRKITYFLLSCSIAEVLFFMLSLIFGTATPLLAIQLLWLNVVTDGFQDLSLSLEKPEKGLMKEKPRSTTESLFSKSMVAQCLVMGLTMGLVVFGSWMILTKSLGFDIVVARSLVMTLMVFLQNIHAFNCRSEKQSVFKTRFNSNWFFFVAVLGSILLQIIFIEVPELSKLLSLSTVPYFELLILLAISFVVLAVCELYKFIIRKKEKNQD